MAFAAAIRRAVTPLTDISLAPDAIFNIGILICAASAGGAVITFVTLKLIKAKHEKQLDDEYGRRR